MFYILLEDQPLFQIDYFRIFLIFQSLPPLPRALVFDVRYDIRILYNNTLMYVFYRAGEKS